MKKKLKKLLTLGIILGLAYTLASCDNTETSVENEIEQESYVQVLSTQAITSYNVVEEGLVGEENNTNSEETNEVDTSGIEQIVEQSEVLLSEDINIELVDSDLEEYNYKLIVTYNENEYIIYVKELRRKIKEPGEFKFRYEGIVKHNDLEYDFEATEEVEKELFEEESEIEFKMHYKSGKFIKIKQEIEEEMNEFESSFKFEFYNENKKVSEYKISKEQEDGKTKIKCEHNGDEFKISFDHHKDGKKRVRIETNDFEYTLEIEDEEIKNIIDEEVKKFLENLKFEQYRHHYGDKEETPNIDTPNGSVEDTE